MARFDFAAGGIRCPRCAHDQVGPRLGPGARAQLLALLGTGDPLPSLDRPRAHLRLLSDFVTWHLSAGRPLSSFEVLAGLLDAESNPPDEDAVQGTDPLVAPPGRQP